MPDPDKRLTTRQAAKQLYITEEQLKELFRQGHIQGYRHPPTTAGPSQTPHRFTQAAVHRFMADKLGMSPEDFKERPLTTGEAADILGLSLSTMNRAFDDKEIRGYRIPGSPVRRIPRRALDEYRQLLRMTPEDVQGSLGLRIPEAAKLLGVSPGIIRGAIKAGHLSSVKKLNSRTLWIPGGAFVRYIDAIKDFPKGKKEEIKAYLRKRGVLGKEKP